MGISSSKNSDCECSKWVEKYKQIKQYYDEAHECIDSGIELEEEDNETEALEKFKNGIGIIDTALKLHIECPDEIDDTWNTACGMIQKLKKLRAEALKRISTIQNNFKQLSSCDEDNEILAEEISQTDRKPRTYAELANELENLKIDSNDDDKELEILFTQDNINVYFISPDGTVETLDDSFTLTLYCVKSEKLNKNEPKAFLEVNDWVYPLIPGVSPCLKTEYDALIVPDIHSSVPGGAIGITLPPGADIKSLLNLLNDIIYGVYETESEHVRGKRRTRRVRRHAPDTISGSLLNGAWYMREGLIRGAHAAGSLISYGTPKLLGYLTPAEKPTAVNPKFTHGLETAKTITGKAVSATGFFAEKLGSATTSMGKFLAPHIQKQGAKMLTLGFKMDEEAAQAHMGDILTVTAGAVESLATVYSGLEQSSAILARSITKNTIKVVEHKYGPDVGHAAGDSLYTVGNIYSFKNSIKLFKPSKMAKVAAKSAGKGFLEDFKEHHQLAPKRHGDLMHRRRDDVKEQTSTITKQTDDFKVPDLTTFYQELQKNANNSTSTIQNNE